MAYMRPAPPTIEEMLEQFSDWMAQHAQAKVTVRLDFRDGEHIIFVNDHRGPKREEVQVTSNQSPTTQQKGEG